MEPDWPELSERQKEVLCRRLPRPKRQPFLRRRRKGGRPRVDDMACFEAILWKAWTDLPWKWLPSEFGKKRTVLSRLNAWQRDWRLSKLFNECARSMTRAEAVRWRGRLEYSLERRKLLWKADFLVALNIYWPARRAGQTRA